mgnify:CR=1 FL=1
MQYKYQCRKVLGYLNLLANCMESLLHGLVKSVLVNTRSKQYKYQCRKVLGYLNLLANCTDNLLHGLAVGTSFLTSWKLGALRYFADFSTRFNGFSNLSNLAFETNEIFIIQ